MADPTPAAAPVEAVRAFWPDGLARSFVGGEWREPTRTEATLDPSTGRVLAEVAVATPGEVQEAVRVAAGAQPAWHRLGLEARVDALAGVAERLAARGEELALLESMDSGNPMFATRRDVGFGVRYLTRWPAYAFSLTGQATTPFDDGLSYTLHQPYGVVGKIVAFNHPSLFAVAGMIFPLLAGNSVVVKAAPQTPLGTLALGALLDSLPPGVVNIVAGGAETGDALVTHPGVKRLAFTGSLSTALTIQSRLSVSGSVKHLSLELGGKNAMIVFPDVDLADAVDAAVAGMSFAVSAGQSCQATSRILVHRDIHDDFVAALDARMRELRVGVAYDPGTQMGPLVSSDQRRRVGDYVRSGVEAGATLVSGGGVPAGLPPGGYWLEPTLFADVDPGMPIASEEIFGPVVVTLPWHDWDEMIAVANGIDLGLSAAVWTRDVDAALRTAAAVDAGYVWVNDANRHYLGAPFGGVKNSGVGREESAQELLSFVETKSVNIRVPLRPRPPDARW